MRDGLCGRQKSEVDGVGAVVLGRSLSSWLWTWLYNLCVSCFVAFIALNFLDSQAGCLSSSTLSFCEALSVTVYMVHKHHVQQGIADSYIEKRI